jgi:hypothetical protein
MPSMRQAGLAIAGAGGAMSRMARRPRSCGFMAAGLGAPDQTEFNQALWKVPHRWRALFQVRYLQPTLTYIYKLELGGIFL